MTRLRPAIRSYSGLLLAGAILLQVSFLPAQNIPIAIMDFDGFGISQVEAIALSNRLRNELFRLGTFEVVDRGMMENILNEQNFQMVGCTSNECLVEVGQLLGARQMVGGSISKVGAMFTVSARVVDVQTGKLLGVSDFDLRGGLEEMLTDGMKQVALMLSGDEAGVQAVIQQQQTEIVLQGVPEKVPSQPTPEQPRTSIVPIGSGHAKTMVSLGLNGIDFALSIDFGQPSAQNKNTQYGMMIGMILPWYYDNDVPWPPSSPFINDKIDEYTTFETPNGDYATVEDLTELDAYGTLFYGMAMVSRSFGWDQGLVGFKLFAAAGYCLGEGELYYHGIYDKYGDSRSFSGEDYYDIGGIMYTLGGQLRLGYPRFSILLGAQLIREPVAGLKPYLSAGILWPF